MVEANVGHLCGIVVYSKAESGLEVRQVAI